MVQNTNASDAGQHEKKYFFFVNDEKFETDEAVVTGAYIKSRIASLPAGSGLELEGHGNEPNKVIGESDPVSLELGHGQGAIHLTTVPPANFG